MLNSKLVKKIKKETTNSMKNLFFTNEMVTLFIIQKNKFNDYNLKH